MAQADLGKVRMTDAELSDKIINVNGGVRLGKDADGKPGYVVTDAETGADTVIPFSSGSGEVSNTRILCFTNSYFTAYGTTTTEYEFKDIFENPIKIENGMSIKITTSLYQWVRLGSTSTSGLKRWMSLKIYFKLQNGTISSYVENLISNNSSSTTITLPETIKTYLLDDLVVSTASDIDEIIGFGCYFSLLAGNTGASYFKTRINYTGYGLDQNIMKFELI